MTKYYNFIDYHTRINKYINGMGFPRRHKPLKKTGYKTRATKRNSLYFKYNRFFIKTNWYKTKYYKLIW